MTHIEFSNVSTSPQVPWLGGDTTASIHPRLQGDRPYEYSRERLWSLFTLQSTDAKLTLLRLCTALGMCFTVDRISRRQCE